MQNGLLDQQHEALMRPLRSSRVAKRQQGGKTLSYLEAWDVRAHLIRMFGFANFDIELLDQQFLGMREYVTKDGKPMVEPYWFAKIQLTVRGERGQALAVYSDAAVGSNAAPDYLLVDAHDNAIKTACSDALKRCAINLGTQFGLSLYDNGSTSDVVRVTVLKPETVEPEAEATAEQVANLEHTLGAQEVQSTEPEAADAEQS
jgi:recombination DNA repair RAD52 pathway protein